MFPDEIYIPATKREIMGEARLGVWEGFVIWPHYPAKGHGTGLLNGSDHGEAQCL